MNLKYDPVKNYKAIKALEPTEVDKVLTWVFLLLGCIFYTFFPDKTGILGILEFAFIYKLTFCLGWLIHWFIQAIYCKKHNLNFDGSKKEDL